MPLPTFFLTGSHVSSTSHLHDVITDVCSNKISICWHQFIFVIYCFLLIIIVTLVLFRISFGCIPVLVQCTNLPEYIPAQNNSVQAPPLITAVNDRAR